jgi:hypothetical protein
MKKIVGVALGVLLLYLFASGFYRGYTGYLNGVEYFELAVQMPVQGTTIETVFIGRVPRHQGWKDAADNAEQGYLQKCGGCRTVRKLRLQTLSDDYSAMFAKKIATYTYISSDKADTRMFFPGLGKDFDMSVCKMSIEQLRKSDGTVVCIGRT